MLRKDLPFRPPAGPVELGDHAGAVVELHLVHTVFVGVQRIADRVRPQSPGLYSLQDAIGGQIEEEIGSFVAAHEGRLTQELDSLVRAIMNEKNALADHRRRSISGTARCPRRRARDTCHALTRRRGNPHRSHCDKVATAHLHSPAHLRIRVPYAKETHALATIDSGY